MDIWHFLFGSRERTLAVLTLPALAAAIAAALVLLAPPTYRSEVRLTLPQLPEEPLQEYILTPYADHVIAVLQDPTALGGETPNLAGVQEIQATHEVGSRLIEALIESREPERLDGLLQPLARDALALVIGQDVAVAQERLELAQRDYDRARAAMDAVVERAGVVEVDDAYDNAASEVIKWRATSAADAAVGNSQGARQASLQADEYTRQQARLAPLLPTYGRARDELDHTGVLLVRAREALQDAQARLNMAGAPAAVTGGQVQRLSQLEPLLRNVLITGVATVALVVVALLLLEALSDRPRPLPRRAPAVDRKAANV
ncbi:MAG: hypothetical protein M3387_06995 [Actinomycetota bacterium]|nr:hypothetical protein [Actinomycetota bacterium]